MPVTRNTPLEKRRVKTGCIACRQRRRKCDEMKPQCTNCDSRRITCEYASAPDPQSGSYADITFVDNSRSFPKTSSNSGIRSVRVARQPSDAPRSSISWQQPTSRTTTHDAAALSSWESYFDAELPEAPQRQIALLRQFRYRTAPWLEAGDPESRFGVAMMQMAQEHEPMQTFLTELASSQLTNRSDSARLHGARVQLSLGAAELRFVAGALISLTETLCTGPLAWKQFRFQHRESSRTMNDVEEPLKTLTRQQSRINLAASILTSTPPSTNADFYLVQHPVSERSLIFFPVYNWALYHLTSCLHFVFRASSASPEAARASPGSPEALSIAGAPPNWHNLWLRTQAWYDTRPMEMQSLVDVGSIEMSQIDPMNSASFPIHLYSSAIAVQAATFYHITALLLLHHKPRLLNVPGRRQHLTSPNWHARAIAGIATSNEFPEQWDPIVIASLLYIAKDITHFAQQHAILECFRNIAAQTGILLEEEAGQLRAQWAAASLVESTLTR